MADEKNNEPKLRSLLLTLTPNCYSVEERLRGISYRGLWLLKDSCEYLTAGSQMVSMGEVCKHDRMKRSTHAKITK